MVCGSDGCDNRVVDSWRRKSVGKANFKDALFPIDNQG